MAETYRRAAIGKVMESLERLEQAYRKNAEKYLAEHEAKKHEPFYTTQQANAKYFEGLAEGLKDAHEYLNELLGKAPSTKRD